MKFREGQYVKFSKFRGRVLRQVDDKYYLVEDRSGRPPRLVSGERMEPGTPWALPAPGGQAA